MDITDPRSGDIVLVRGQGWLGKLIRFVQRLRYRSREERPFTYWSHSALVTSAAGHIIEVTHRGVAVRHLKKYRDQEYYYVYLDLSDGQRRQTAQFAYSCVGQKYGTMSSILLGFIVLFGDRFRIPDLGQQGCGSLIVRALLRAGVRIDREPADTLPADLAKHFDIRPEVRSDQAAIRKLGRHEFKAGAVADQ